ncbi:hypothetical protein BOO86_15080 [Mycobacterium sp. CBMA 234]|nr:hypothetical protein [Mycolicibacterium sp. CBMA 234]
MVALIATWWNNIAYFSQADSGGLTGLIKAGYANYASTSFTNDLLLVFLAAVILMIVEARRIGMHRVWIYIALGFIVAISVAFPLYLIARQVRLAQLREAGRSL